MKRYLALPVLLGLIAWCGPAMAHALLERAAPGANASLEQVPKVVTLYFDAELEPVFSKLTVKNAQGVKVSQGNGEVAASNRRILSVPLSASEKGIYHVHWNVVSHDGHRAQGEYSFTVK